MTGISGYKEKYLAALDEQEKLERKHALQLDLLRKTIVHLSVAAKGQESKLDASLIALQNKMRGGSGADVFEQMERVQRAVGEFDREREQELQRVLDWFKSAVDNLMELSVPADLRSQLSLYKKGLKSQLTSYRAFGEAVNELSALQKRALAAAANPNKGLWQRIKGGKTLEDNAPAKPSRTSAEPVEAPVERDLGPKESVTKTPPITQVDDPAAEDSYPKVAQRINATLKALVTSIEPNDMVRRKVEIVRDRIDRGMDWFALAVTLEDIRDILMARYLAADKAFSEYLLNINRELVSIRDRKSVV